MVHYDFGWSLNETFKHELGLPFSAEENLRISASSSKFHPISNEVEEKRKEETLTSNPE
ncbi:uncharacterized protein G2W53_031124 [Senna tora]|uniref:Uncharacterized protein n=1 Tax=Senna tora TaxID=362788 RepID=A0A834T8P4_9FABA|nr:uncharacterized protein G2W53_031124 [Senna tora]